MNYIAAVFETPLALGSAVSIPFAIFIICLVIRVQPMVALRTSFSVGFSMVGISLMIGRFGQMLTDMAAMILENSGVAVQVVDVGRRAATVITTTSEIGIYVMPLAILINILMLVTRSTRTINLDLWSFWLFAFMGAMVQSLTGNITYGMIAATTAVVFTLVMADSSVKGVEKCCAIYGVSYTNAVTASFGPIGGAVSKLMDMIPLKGKKDITFGWIQKRIGYIGDPCILGTVLALVIGVANGMEGVSALQVAVQFGAYIFIIPKIMLLLGDSLKPMAASLAEFSRNKLKLHSSLTIGMSSGIGLGNPTALLLSVAMVPTMIWMATLLPNNNFTPSADFSMLPYMIIMVVAICRGGIFRSVISCLISGVVMLYSSSILSGLFSQAAVAADPETYGGMGMVSSMYGAGNPLTLGVTWISSFGIAGMGLLVVLILWFAIWNYNRLTGNVRIYVKKQKAMRTFAIDNIQAEAQRRRELRKNAVSKKREELRKAVENDKIARIEGIKTTPIEAEQLTIFGLSGDNQGKPKKADATENPVAAETGGTSEKSNADIPPEQYQNGE